MNSRDQVLSLLSAANNHADLAVKLSSLRQVQDLLSSSLDHQLTPLVNQVAPFFSLLRSSPHPRVRILLLQVIEDIGLRVLDHSLPLLPVLLDLSKDRDPDVSNQSIVSGTKFFSAVLEELTRQYHRHGKVQRWTEEMWVQMTLFKNEVVSLAFEPASVGKRLLGLKFLECFVLQFTPDTTDSDRRTSGAGSERGFNISWLAGGHPVLDVVKLRSEANKLFARLLDMLHSSSNISGPLTIAVVNCLAAIARKRPDHYNSVLSALLNIQSETTRRCHAASLQYSVRTALLGFLRCTHPLIIESRDKLVRVLQSMNAGDAVDQVLRQIDKIMRISERSSREPRVSKEDLSSAQIPVSGVLAKRKLTSVDTVEPTDSLEMAPKRVCFNSNGRESDLQLNEPGVNNSGNGLSSEVPILNDVDPVEQMVVVIAALLAQGEKASGSVELLISQMHPDLLADIVISNMKHMPKTPPAAKQGSLPLNSHSNSAPVSLSRGAAPEISVSPSVVASQGGTIPTCSVSTSLPDSSSSTILPADTRRDPRRDPRRLDPRKVAAPIEALSSVDETICVPSRSEGLLHVDDSPSVASALSAVQIVVQQPETHLDEKNSRPSLFSESEKERPKEESVDGAKETSLTVDNNVIVDNTLPPVLKDDENSAAQMTDDVELTDSTVSPFVPEFDHYSPPTLDATPSEETWVDLPQVPSYVDLSHEQTQLVSKLAVERTIRSFKELKSNEFCRTRMAILAKMVPWMEADDAVTIMVQEDIVSGYREQQGHELVMHVLYYLHSLMTSESSDHSPGAAVLYEKFLLGMAKSLLDTLPASDKSFSRLLGEAPTLTDSVMKLLENLCCPDGFDRTGRDTRDDRITQGLGTVWSLILGRPVNRQPCLTIALKCAFHPEDDTRAKAIRLVANKLYPLDYVSDSIEEYATKMLLSAVKADAFESGTTGLMGEVGGEGASQHSVSGACTEKLVKGALPISQTSVSMSVGEAQRMISLYFALCTKKPDLLQLVFDIYAGSGRSVKQAFHRHVPILMRALGSSYSQLLRIISNPPSGSENLLMLVLQILAEQTTPSPELINTVKYLYETKLKDATVLIPMLSSLSRDEVLPIFPRLIDLPLDKFQQALARILQGSAHTGPALTPAEVLVAIHDIVPEKEGIALKKITDACSACFEQRTVFTEHVLAKALNQMVDQTPLPLLFMRTVIQAIGAFPTLVDFVMEVLSKLVSRQIWKMPKLWVGFLKCVSQTQPHSFRVLLQLPAPQLESALNKYGNLRSSLAAYSSQPSIKSSLPRTTLSILGLVHESHKSEPQNASSLHTSDSSCVRGTST